MIISNSKFAIFVLSRAAHCAIDVYLRLHDKPVTDKDTLGEIDTREEDLF